MFTRKINYVDLNGHNQSVIAHFHLFENEIVRLQVSFPGGLDGYLKALQEDPDPQKILFLFEELVKASYGRKSADGQSFEKSEEIVRQFTNHAAYNALFMELFSDPNKAAEFFNSLVPQEISGANSLN